jgi:co-chaperonin GroES (HSP10)
MNPIYDLAIIEIEYDQEEVVTTENGVTLFVVHGETEGVHKRSKGKLVGVPLDYSNNAHYNSTIDPYVSSYYRSADFVEYMVIRRQRITYGVGMDMADNKTSITMKDFEYADLRVGDEVYFNYQYAYKDKQLTWNPITFSIPMREILAYERNGKVVICPEYVMVERCKPIYTDGVLEVSQPFYEDRVIVKQLDVDAAYKVGDTIVIGKGEYFTTPINGINKIFVERHSILGYIPK